MREINLVFDVPAEIGPIAITNEFNATRISMDVSGVLGDYPDAFFSIHLYNGVFEYMAMDAFYYGSGGGGGAGGLYEGVGLGAQGIIYIRYPD